MGLDNGIIFSTYATQKENTLQFPFKYIEGSKNENRVELIYHRKDGGLRNDIVDYLNSTYPNKIIEGSRTALSEKDIREIIKILRSGRNERHGDTNGASIGQYKEDGVRKHLSNEIKALTKFLDYYQKRKCDIREVYFYDSY